MMVKSGLEKIILKFHEPLQICCCPVQKNLPRNAELAWQVSSEGARGISKYCFLDHFSPSYLGQKLLSTYFSRAWSESRNSIF